MSPRLRSPRQDWGRGQRPNSVETSAWDPNSYSHKSRALTNLETRFEEFESLLPSHTISPCVFNNLRSRVIFTSELASTSNSVFSSLSGSHHRRGPSGHRRSPAVGQTRVVVVWLQHLLQTRRETQRKTGRSNSGLKNRLARAAKMIGVKPTAAPYTTRPALPITPALKNP